MRRIETASNPVGADDPRGPEVRPEASAKFKMAVHDSKFIPARDSRNRRVPALYVRNDRYYAQLWVDTGNGKKSPRRLPLFDADNLPVRTVQAAKLALEIKRHERRENKLPTGGRKPLLADYCDIYFEKG